MGQIPRPPEVRLQGGAPERRNCLAGWQARQRLVDAILVTTEPSLVRERHVEPDTPVKAATSTA